MMESGVVSPPIGATYDLEDFGRALSRHGGAPHARQVGRAGPPGSRLPRAADGSGRRGCVVVLVLACLTGLRRRARRRAGQRPSSDWSPAPARADGLSVLAAGGRRRLPAAHRLGRQDVPARDQPRQQRARPASPASSTRSPPRDYRRWFGEMAGLGIRVIRIYTLHPPAFYDELAA